MSLAQQHAADSPAPDPPASRSNPYIGLRPFDSADSLYFFGRREQTAELLERLHETHFLAVLGSSGSGKSSLIRAGLIPALLGGFLVEERDRWRIAVMKPGNDPLRNLAAALCDGESPGPDEDEVATLVRAIGERHTQALIDRLMPQLGADTNLLLLVDQFEEVFAFRGAVDTEDLTRLGPSLSGDLARRRVEAAEFVDLIVDLSERSDLPIYTTLTMRTDFLGDCDLFYGLPEAINRGRYLVPRLTRQQLKQAIEGPALIAQAPIAPRLLDRLLNKLGDRTDRLPVLQHVLLRTWELWQRAGEGSIDLRHYEAAGTLGNALSMHADEALRDEDLEATARIFKRLTDTDRSYRRVRRPAVMNELVAISGLDRPAVEAILERFRGGGRHFLVLSPGASPGDPRVEISHESLIRQWDQLRRWVDEERESRDRFVELVIGARREAAGQAALLRDPALRIALDWRASAEPDAVWAERYLRKDDDFELAMDYLDRSRAAAEAHARRRKRFRAVLSSAAAAVILALVGLASWALVERRDARQAALEARDQARLALASEWLQKDPTKAALILLELERAEDTPFAAQRMYQALGFRLAAVELAGHQDWVLAASFSRDGRHVVTASEDRTARIWATSGEELAVLEHSDAVSVASYSSDGERILTASWDTTARIWDAATGEERLRLEGHASPLLAAELSADGTRAVTASDDGAVRVWDTASGRLVTALREDGRTVSSVSFDREGTRVLIAANDPTVRVLDVASGRQVVTLEGHTGWVTAASFDPTARRVLTASEDATARIWDAATGRELIKLAGHSAPVSVALFDPRGTRVLTASDDRTARIWDADSGRPIAGLMGHAGPVSAAAFGSEGLQIVTASFDRTARLWSSAAGVAAAKLVGHDEKVLDAAFDPEGERVITASYDKTARIWDAASGAELERLEGHDKPVLSASFSPDGARVVTASDDGTARIWDPSGERLDAFTTEAGEGVVSASFIPEGARVVTASIDGTARVWDLVSGVQQAVLEGHEGSISTASFSRDGARVVTASDDRTARIWDAESGAGASPAMAHDDAVTSASFSTDGRRIVTSSDDQTAKIWGPSGQAIGTLMGHELWVWSASFSADGNWVVTASADETARIWDAESGTEVATLEGHGGPVLAAAFSPDGTWVVTASEDRTARIWWAPGEALQALIRERTSLCLASGFRETTLGEPRETAESRHRSCQECLGVFRRAGLEASAKVPALRAYKQCLGERQ